MILLNIEIANRQTSLFTRNKPVGVLSNGNSPNTLKHNMGMGG